MEMYTLIAAAALLLSGAASAQPTASGGCIPGAHTFCVVSTADTDGTTCGLTTCTLRQAINASNTAGGANTIGFNIPTNPAHPTPQKIKLASQPPTINTDSNLTSLTIDGYSQPGSMMNTNAPDQGGLDTKLMIEIVGNGGFGFSYNCCDVPFITLTLRGLNLHGFDFPAFGFNIGPTPKAQWNIYGCFVSTNINGTALPMPPVYDNVNTYGIEVPYDNAQIGGTQPWQRNLVSGNGNLGIEAGGPDTTVIIEGNLIGTDANGTLPILGSPDLFPPVPGLVLHGNLPGLRVGCTGAGCLRAASRNVISGNSTGITMEGTHQYPRYTYGGAQIKGNYIGTDWTGTRPLPNGILADLSGRCPTYCGGIQTFGDASGPALIIGGFTPGEANLIAYNEGPGIWAYDNGSPNLGASFDNQANKIHNNRTDVAFDQNDWIPNDPGDADTGVNNRQNYPVIQSASVSGGKLTVTYSVDSATANSSYPLRIDFYVDVDEGSGEFLVSDLYPASSAQLLRTITLALPADAQALVGIVATATTADHYTSEFSPSYVFDWIFADRFEGH